MILSKNVHQAFAARDFNLSRLATDSGIPRRTLGRILAQYNTPMKQAEYLPSTETLQKLAGFFQVDQRLLNTRLPASIAKQ